MKMVELIDSISALYRQANSELCALRKEYKELERKEMEIEETHGEFVTLLEASQNATRLCDLSREILIKEAYCDGISDVREFLFNINETEDIK